MVLIRSPLDSLPMPDLALRGLSPHLHDALKAAAERNHRSLNGEILARLEASVGLLDVDVEVLLDRIQERRHRSPVPDLTADDLRDLKEEGRS